MKHFFNNHIFFFTNCQHTIDALIIKAGYLLDSVTISNKITISEMPEVQVLTLIIVRDEFFEQF